MSRSIEFLCTPPALLRASALSYHIRSLARTCCRYLPFKLPLLPAV
ncbi:hypothetical protein [Methanimicrococcus blatticola]|nr:hypothetical protein [Methanimicrococcus blatticola]MBZ3935696.1 hypothetical protein [Methanimicrococcus blatticola]MCC2508183.1 hypothetical protein [Methanimicrococcus blatticola]